MKTKKRSSRCLFFILEGAIVPIKGNGKKEVKKKEGKTVIPLSKKINKSLELNHE
jgi:hypothetical protein